MRQSDKKRPKRGSGELVTRRAEGSGRKRVYPSQEVYEEYGGVMCTPVCVILAERFVRGVLSSESNEPFECVTNQVVLDVLRDAHEMHRQIMEGYVRVRPPHTKCAALPLTVCVCVSAENRTTRVCCR